MTNTWTSYIARIDDKNYLIDASFARLAEDSKRKRSSAIDSSESTHRLTVRFSQIIAIFYFLLIQFFMKRDKSTPLFRDRAVKSFYRTTVVIILYYYIITRTHRRNIILSH